MISLALGSGVGMASVSRNSERSLTSGLTLTETWVRGVAAPTPALLNSATSVTLGVTGFFGEASNGVILEAGGTTFGTILYCLNGNLYFSAGAGATVNATNSIQVTVALPKAYGRLEVSTSLSACRVYFNGVQIATGTVIGTPTSLAGSDGGAAGLIGGSATPANLAGWTAGQGAPNSSLVFDQVEIYLGQTIP